MSQKPIFHFSCIMIFIILLSGCRKNFEYIKNISSLQFSADSIVLDTAFVKTTSPIYVLKVFNRSDDDIEIPKIYLEKGNASFYHINVDGRMGYEFYNLPLRARDSMSVFIVQFPQTAEKTVYEDNICFEYNQRKRKVNIQSFIGDAVYYLPKKGEKQILLKEDKVFGRDKYHIICGELVVEQGKVLTIKPGANILFQKKGAIVLQPKASIKAEGTLKSPITFRGYRFDTRHDSLPGQWKGIQCKENSHLSINYAIIKGGTTSIALDKASASLHNTKIYNSEKKALSAKDSKIEGENLVINNAGEAAVYLKNSGDYKFVFSSIANYWQQDIAGAQGDNYPFVIEQDQEAQPIKLILQNSILYGRAPEGLLLKQTTPLRNTIVVGNSIIKQLENRQRENGSLFQNIITQPPMFKSCKFSRPDLRLKENSPGKLKATPIYNHLYPRTIEGKERTQTPDIGAY